MTAATRTATAGTQALIVVGHGSHHNPWSSASVYAHADRIRRRGLFDEVREAFWKEEPALHDVLRAVESEVAFVVPVLMSRGYFADEVVPRELGVADERALDLDPDVRYTPPIGTHDAMTDVIVERVESVTGDAAVGPGVGVAVVGHGTERNERSARSTRYHAARIRERGRFDEVGAFFLDEPPFVGDVTHHFETPEIAVVPVFAADGYHTTEDVPADLGLPRNGRGGYDSPATVDGRRIWYAGAVGTEPRLADLVVERAAEAGATFEVPSEPPAADPPIDALVAAADDGVAFDGLAAARGPDGYAFAAGATRREKLDEAAFRALAARHADYVSNWHAWEREIADGGTARRAFLRWLERAGELSVPERSAALRAGVTREWGEAAITARLDGEARRYEVRHRDDADADPDDLEVHADPTAVVEVARFDDAGRYRPLAAARSLSTGWALNGLTGRELVRAIDRLYPATIAAWHRERAGRLDVTNYRTTAARQTGIYADVDRLSGPELACAAEAVCGDCVKRRAWDESDDAPIDAARGDGLIPCREACSVFLEAARTFVELDPADAEDRDDDAPAGAIDHPAHPYRRRYLAAKRARGHRATRHR